MWLLLVSVNWLPHILHDICRSSMFVLCQPALRVLTDLVIPGPNS